MTDPVPEPERRRSLLSRILARLSIGSEATLRESFESAIASHDAQNPAEAMKAEAKSMMLNLIEFADLRVDDVMVPRADIVAIEDTATVRALLDRFIDANHSRLPVYRDTLDGIAGMIHVKDLLRWLAARGKTKRRRTAKADAPDPLTLAASDLATPVKSLALLREVLFVPPSMPASDLLVKMQASHVHLAIVVDEYGGTDGLVSIEDIMEEIVGDIADEHDENDEPIKQTDEGVYVADARADLEELEQLLGVDLLPDEREADADTLGGLIFALLGRVPARGELIRHASGVEFEVLDSDPRRVKKLRIHMQPADPPPSGDVTPPAA